MSREPISSVYRAFFTAAKTDIATTIIYIYNKGIDKVCYNQVSNVTQTEYRKEGANINRVYWVGMLAVTRKACIYYQRWIGFLPAELRTQASNVLVPLEAFCLVLQEYDKSHARGRGVSP